MQKVVNISLNGVAYQLEEPGYNLLRDYLERAEARLKDSPDRNEVMADLEQAIGEKCRAVLGPHKTVVNTPEVEKIIEEMGPVESPDAKEKAAGSPGDAPADTSSSAGSPPPRKRLFRIREGAMCAGVCNGLAAYFNVDVTWIRLTVIVLAIFSSGLGILGYAVLAFVLPAADTPEDRAAAFGMPFNTEELISRAKKNFEEFGQTYRWRREWRRQQRHWNRQFRNMNEQLRTATATAAPVAGPVARAVGGAFVVIAAIVGAVVFVCWLLAMFSLISQHSIFGWALPHGIPLWVGIVGLIVLYTMVSAPLRMIRHGAHGAGTYHAGWNAFHGLMWTGFAVLLFWVAYSYIPGVRELVDHLLWAANLTASTISDTMVHLDR
jgi:phage shock protein PspC (stress-responsive transcriptional regulator)